MSIRLYGFAAPEQKRLNSSGLLKITALRAEIFLFGVVLSVLREFYKKINKNNTKMGESVAKWGQI
jgi:hypothetical protein